MRVWLACAAVLWLAACAPTQETPDAAQTLGPSLTRFVAEGRIALRQGERRDHLRFRWEREADSDTVLLMSPLGQGIAALSRDAAGARLIQPGQPTIAAATLPQLAERVFGAPLPLEAMADWLRAARPALSGEVDGWRVLISETLPYHQRRLLRVLEASRDDIQLKLIVDDWDVPE